MMNSAPIVSFIIPVFNAEKSVARAVNAIRRQTIREIEIIVVDDGSKDATADIIQTIAAEDARVRILTVENGGPARARNAALDMVDPAAKYIMFSDADDELAPDAAEKAIRTAEKTDADLVLFGYSIVNVDGSINRYFEPDAIYCYEQLGEHLVDLYKANLLNQVWAKLFRADLIQRNGIRFKDYRWGEDRIFVFECLKKQQKLAVLSDCMYSYFMHGGESLIGEFYEKKPEVCIQADTLMQELCSGFGVEEESYCRYMFIKSVFSCLTNMYSETCSLTVAEKRDYTAKIVHNQYVHARCAAPAGGAMPKMMGAVLRTGNVSLNMAAAHFGVLIEKMAPKFFQKVKHRK